MMPLLKIDLWRRHTGFKSINISQSRITYQGRTPLSSWNNKLNCRLKSQNVNLSARQRGGDLGGAGGIVPLKYLGGGDGGAFIPPMFTKCHFKLTRWKRLRRRETRYDTS